MEEIMAMADKIGQMILDSEIHKRVKRASDRYMERPDLSALIEEYNQKDAVLRSGKVAEDLAKDLQNRLREIYDTVTKDPDYIEFSEAQRDLDTLMAKVAEEINFVVTGHRGCDHCGGCDCDDCSCDDDCGCGCGE